MTGVYAERMLLRCVLVNESMSTSLLVPRDYNNTASFRKLTGGLATRLGVSGLRYSIFSSTDGDLSAMKVQHFFFLFTVRLE